MNTPSSAKPVNQSAAIGYNGGEKQTYGRKRRVSRPHASPESQEDEGEKEESCPKAMEKCCEHLMQKDRVFLLGTVVQGIEPLNWRDVLPDHLPPP